MTTKRVPVEPTLEIAKAMMAELPEHGDTAGALVLCKAMWRAGVAAAPQDDYIEHPLDEYPYDPLAAAPQDELARECLFVPYVNREGLQWATECGEFYFFTMDDVRDRINFCPNCGGKVRVK